MLLFLIGLFLSVDLQAANLSAVDCPIPDNNSTKPKDLISEIYGKVTELKSPFQAACKEKGDLDHQLKTGIGHRQLPSMDSKRNKASDFFLLLLGNIEKYILDNLVESENIYGCLNRPKGRKDCLEVWTWGTTEVPEKVKAARIHLALGAEEGAASAKDLYFINAKLDTLGTYKKTPWQKLTPEETQFSADALKMYNGQARKIMQENATSKNSVDRVAYMDAELREVRATHRDEYLKLIAQMPLMNYLSSPKPSLDEIKDASKKVYDNGLKELAKIRYLKAEILKNPRVLYEDLFYAANYGSVLEQTLLENPKYCVIGASVHHTAKNRKISDAILMGAPLLVASMLAPPLGAAAIGVVAGTAYAAQTHKDYKQTQQRNLGKIHSENGFQENEELRQDLKNRNISIAMIPLAGVVSGGASKGAQIGQGTSLFRKKRLFPLTPSL